MGFMERLRKGKEEHAKQIEEKGKYEQLEAGSYKMQWLKGELSENNDAQGQCIIDQVILSGDRAGDINKMFFNLEKIGKDKETVWGQVFLGQTLEKLEKSYEGDPDDLIETLAQLNEETPIYMVEVKHTEGEVDGVKKTFVNVSIKRLLETSSEAEHDVQGEVDPDEQDVEAAANEIVGDDADMKTVYTKDRRIFGMIDDTWYPGKVLSCNKTKVKVEFDDGDVEQMVFADLKLDPDAENGNVEESVDNDELIAFCQAQDIEVDDNDSTEAIIAKMMEWDFLRSQLTKKEVALCESAGIPLV